MKTYKVKNYKGNLVESLSKFQKSHKGMKIVEACEDGDDLKIKAEESEKQPVEEAVGKKVYVLMYKDELSMPTAICTSIEEAKKIAEAYEDEMGYTPFEITEYDLDKWDLDDNHYRSVKKI